MYFDRVIGQEQIKKQLLRGIEQNRIPHAQLLYGATGSGPLPMAIAYAQAILCSAHEKGSDAYKNCAKRVIEGNHPDLHFIFPVNRRTGMNRPAISKDYMNEWRSFINETPYGSVYQWLQHIGIGNKQGNIGVSEAKEISRSLSFKAFESGYKVLVLWMPEQMNIACANALLKLIEEPPSKSVLLLVSEDANQVLGTIRSRCQLLHLPPLTETVLSEALQTKEKLSASEANLLSKQAQGSYTNALTLLHTERMDTTFEAWFIQWVRTAFKARGNKSVLLDLLEWSDTVAASGREPQKQFLQFCSEIFRQAFLLNYKTPELVYYKIQDKSFQLKKFAPFIHNQNIFEIFEAIETANYHIERNGNPKSIFTDLSIQLTRLLHKKQ